MVPNSDSAFQLERVLILNMIRSGRAMTFSIYVYFHYNGGIISFGVVLWLIFSPSWISLDLTVFLLLISLTMVI